MAFEHKQYADGENSYRLPQWRKDIESLRMNIDSLSYLDRMKNDETIKENEIGMKHPTNGSFIRIKDDGTIEAFTGYGSGFRLTTDESIQFFGNHIQMIGKETQLVSRPNQTNLNGETLAGGYPSLKEKGLTNEFIESTDKLNRERFKQAGEMDEL